MTVNKQLPDVQDDVPQHPIRIDRVGVKNVKRRVIIEGPKGELQFDVTIDAYVDLPIDKRGVHMSRNIMAFIEAIDAARLMVHPTVEKVLDKICDMLLEKHEYSSYAEVHARTTYFYEEDFTGTSTSEAADVEIKVFKSRDGITTYTTKVSVLGMTVCPCAQQVYSSIDNVSLPHAPSHTQKAKLSISLTTRDGFVRIEKLIDVARRSFSSPTVSLLKKYDEYKLIKHAFKNPRFVEDVVRSALYQIYECFSKVLPGDTMVEVEILSYESIHPHDVYAHSKTTLEELGDEIKSNMVSEGCK